MPNVHPQLASRSMPLCMNHLHSELKRAHHLKHWGRLQYVLFLKGIGLTLEHCLDFWRQEFTQRITLEDFQKRFAHVLCIHHALALDSLSLRLSRTDMRITFATLTVKRASAKTTLLTVAARLFSAHRLPPATPTAVRSSTGTKTMFVPNFPK